MGREFEAKNHENLSPFEERLREIKQLLQRTNADVNKRIAYGTMSAGYPDRSALAEIIRDEKIDEVAHFLADRKQGFARHHVQRTVFALLALHASRNLPEPQDIELPSPSQSMKPIITIERDGEVVTDIPLDPADVLRGHNIGVNETLRALSDPYIGRLDGTPDINSGIFIPLNVSVSGEVLLDAPTRLTGVNLRVLGTPNGDGKISLPHRWLTVQQIPESV